MARIRSIKPEFWADEELAMKLSRDARLLFIALWNLADDSGRMRGHPHYVKGSLFPYDDIDVVPLIEELIAADKVVRYWRDGYAYLWVRSFEKHQKIDKRTASRLPPPSDDEKRRKQPKQLKESDVVSRSAENSGEPAEFTPTDQGEEQGAGNRDVEQGCGSVQPQAVPVEPEHPGGELFDLQPPPQEKIRKLSRQQRTYWAFRSLRTDQGIVLPDETWSVQRINGQLGPLMQYSDEQLSDVGRVFFEDEWYGSLDPPWPLRMFVKHFEKNLSKAQRLESAG